MPCENLRIHVAMNIFYLKQAPMGYFTNMLNAPDYFDDMLDTTFEVNDTAFYLHFDDMLQIILMTLH